MALQPTQAGTHASCYLSSQACRPSLSCGLGHACSPPQDTWNCLSTYHWVSALFREPVDVCMWLCMFFHVIAASIACYGCTPCNELCSVWFLQNQLLSVTCFYRFIANLKCGLLRCNYRPVDTRCVHWTNVSLTQDGTSVRFRINICVGDRHRSHNNVGHFINQSQKRRPSLQTINLTVFDVATPVKK